MSEREFYTVAQMRSVGISHKREELFVDELGPHGSWVYICGVGSRQAMKLRKLQEIQEGNAADEEKLEQTVKALSEAGVVRDGENVPVPAEILGDLAPGTLNKITQKFLHLNGLTAEAREELEKNLETRDGADSSDLPTPSATPTPI